jgi:hypothetical protein
MSQAIAPKTGTVDLQFVDGSEHTLPIHGLRALEFVGIYTELGLQSWEEAQAEALAHSLKSIRLALKIVSSALTFPDGERWTEKKLQDTLTELALVKACFKAVELSVSPEMAEVMKKAEELVRPSRTSGAYA